MSGDIVVSGGAGGVGARLQDLRSQAGLLDDAGDDVRAWSGAVAAVAVHQDVTVATLLCPVEVAQVAGAVAGATIGVNGLLIVSTGLEASAIVLRASATTYEFVDATQQQVMEALQNAAGFALGAALPFLGGGLVIAGTGFGLAVVSNPAMWPALITAARSGAFDDIPGDAMAQLHNNPWLMEGLSRMAPGMVQGSVWSMSTLFGGPLGGLLLPTILSGGHWPTGSYEDAVGGLINAGGLLGMFHDVIEPGVQEVSDFPLAAAPTSVSDVFMQQGYLGSEQTEGRIQIVSVPQADGTTAYVVQIPGTQEWSPFRGDNPVDLTTNVHLMAGDSTLKEQQIILAMREAGIRPGDPVMLTGHSQGGITAAALASDPAFRDQFSVRSVVTGGSPIARFDIPADIDVLALEHQEDAVPMLDGRANPDRTNWVTVSRSLPAGSALQFNEDDMTMIEPGAPGPATSHSLPSYAATGALVDASSDPSVERWRADQQIFFAEGGTVRQWDVSSR